MMRCGNRRGALLMEVLLAVVILSVSLTLIVQSLASSLRATVYSLNYAKAAFLADNKMFDLFQASLGFEEGVGVRHFDPPFDAYRYQLHQEGLKDNPKLSMVRLDVLWGEEERERIFSLETALRTSNSQDTM
ncbi:hypothetical protein ACFL49_02995 [Candidatus Omnitrophota bacterium]